MENNNYLLYIVFRHPVALLRHFLLSIPRQYATLITVQYHSIIRCGTAIMILVLINY
jgi:hypothetical protein